MGSEVLPVGEEAFKSRNKVYKYDRLHHSRNNSRLHSLADVFDRAMDTSDSIISSLNLSRRIKKHKNLSLPIGVKQLLSCEYENDIMKKMNFKTPAYFF